MSTSYQRIRGWLYLGILPVLLLGFSSHTLKPNGKLLHPRMPHRTFRMASRTGEACVVDHVDGDRQQAAVVSLPSAHERPKDIVSAALPAAAPVLFGERFTISLARGNIEHPPLAITLDSQSPRGPPTLS